MANRVGPQVADLRLVLLDKNAVTVSDTTSDPGRLSPEGLVRFIHITVPVEEKSHDIQDRTRFDIGIAVKLGNQRLKP